MLSPAPSSHFECLNQSVCALRHRSVLAPTCIPKATSNELCMGLIGHFPSPSNNVGDELEGQSAPVSIVFEFVVRSMGLLAALGLHVYPTNHGSEKTCGCVWNDMYCTQRPFRTTGDCLNAQEVSDGAGDRRVDLVEGSNVMFGHTVTCCDISSHIL